MLREAYRFFAEEFDVDFKAILCLILAGISLVLSTGFQLYTKIRYIFSFWWSPLSLSILTQLNISQAQVPNQG